MKKILLVTRPLAPPWDEASKNFAFFLAKNTPGFEFHLLTNGRIADLPAGVKQEPIYTSNHLSLSQKARLLKALKLKNKMDVIHFMMTPNKLNAFAFKTFFKTSRAKTIQTIATLREDLFSDEDFKQILFADLIITYSDYAKNKLNALGFRNAERIYPGIDLEYYRLTEKDENTLSEFGIQNSDFVVTYPGEYVRLGAMDDLVEMTVKNIEAMKEKKIKLMLACRVKNQADAVKKEAAIARLRSAGALSNVIFTDTFSDMAKLYNVSDVIIFPVRNMQGKFDVPLAAIEPMACEKPVIVSNLPILKEFAKPENSVTIPRGDGDALMTAILDLYAHPEKRATLGQSGRQFAQNNFDIKKVAEKYAKIYEQI